VPIEEAVSILEQPMANTPKKPSTRTQRMAKIDLPDGDTLVRREDFAKETIGVSDRTARRLNLPTTYVGGQPYVKQNASLQVLAEKAQPGLI
jgi:hypothetical protein